MSFGKRLLAAALLTSVVAVGLIPAVAQTAPAPANPGAMRADARHHARIAPSEQGKTRFGSTYPNLGSDALWIHFPTHPGHIFGKLRHVPPGDPVQLTNPPPVPWRRYGIVTHVPPGTPSSSQRHNRPRGSRWAGTNERPIFVT